MFRWRSKCPQRLWGWDIQARPPSFQVTSSPINSKANCVRRCTWPKRRFAWSSQLSLKGHDATPFMQWIVKEGAISRVLRNLRDDNTPWNWIIFCPNSFKPQNEFLSVPVSFTNHNPWHPCETAICKHLPPHASWCVKQEVFFLHAWPLPLIVKFETLQFMSHFLYDQYNHNTDHRISIETNYDNWSQTSHHDVAT